MKLANIQSPPLAITVWKGRVSSWLEKWNVLNRAQRVHSARSCREEFRMIAWPVLSGREAAGSVEITLMPSHQLQRSRERRRRGNK